MAADALLIGFGSVASLAALGVLVVGGNATRASLAFTGVLLSVGGTLAVTGAHAIAAAWMWIQAGGTLAAFGFGLHLQNLEHPGFVSTRNRVLKLCTALALCVGVAEGIRAWLAGPGAVLAAPPATLRSVGRVLFTDALLVVELIPLLLAAGTVVVLALWRDEEAS